MIVIVIMIGKCEHVTDDRDRNSNRDRDRDRDCNFDRDHECDDDLDPCVVILMCTCMYMNLTRFQSIDQERLLLLQMLLLYLWEKWHVSIV